MKAMKKKWWAFPKKIVSEPNAAEIVTLSFKNLSEYPLRY